MNATGTIDPVNRTFDILGVNESATNITVVNGTLRLSYTNPDGKLIQLTKQLHTGDDIVVGSQLGTSSVTENGVGGFAQKTNSPGFAKALTNVSWDDTSHLTSKTFTDANGVNRTAVLLPVVMS